MIQLINENVSNNYNHFQLQDKSSEDRTSHMPKSYYIKLVGWLEWCKTGNGSVLGQRNPECPENNQNYFTYIDTVWFWNGGRETQCQENNQLKSFHLQGSYPVLGQWRKQLTSKSTAQRAISCNQDYQYFKFIEDVQFWDGRGENQSANRTINFDYFTNTEAVWFWDGGGNQIVKRTIKLILLIWKLPGSGMVGETRVLRKHPRLFSLFGSRPVLFWNGGGSQSVQGTINQDYFTYMEAAQFWDGEGNQNATKKTSTKRTVKISKKKGSD